MKKSLEKQTFCGELFPVVSPGEMREPSLGNRLPAGTGDADGELPGCDWGNLFNRLAQSSFRSRFRLSGRDLAYIDEKGLDVVARHAADFIGKRLAPAIIPNDGRQTPMRGHPVFVAQHATGCCCRGCFEKWHHIPAGRALSPAEQRYAVAVVMAWIRRQVHRP